ncbi:MAG: YbhB/YbcL family Raf kinase inhibitor-like protein [Rhodospirillales bacterium]|nr:YbhB/YbcL family Raf kinase inhibitor-like protein [Rhodospirillales bacterium]
MSKTLQKEFSLTSPTLKENSPISSTQYLNDFGCTGANERPVLKWNGAPEATKSFAVTFYDKDAPTGSGFWHWVVYDIPAGTTELPADSLPEGTVEGNTDFGVPGYAGPCPPVGRKHNYTFTVHALDVDKLDAPENATAALAGFFIYQHTLAKATFTVTAGPRSE